jgi:hypothetical protein
VESSAKTSCLSRLPGAVGADWRPWDWMSGTRCLTDRLSQSTEGGWRPFLAGETAKGPRQRSSWERCLWLPERQQLWLPLSFLLPVCINRKRNQASKPKQKKEREKKKIVVTDSETRPFLVAVVSGGRETYKGILTWTPLGVMSSWEARSFLRAALGFVSRLKTDSRILSWAEVVRFLCLTSLGV